MRPSKTSRAWIGALAALALMAAERAHVIHSVRFADAAKVFGLASGSGFLRGNGSGGLEEAEGSPPVLPTPVAQSLLNFNGALELIAATSPVVAGTLTAGAVNVGEGIVLDGETSTISSGSIDSNVVRGTYFIPTGGAVSIHLAGEKPSPGESSPNYVLVGALQPPPLSGPFGDAVALGRQSAAEPWGVALGDTAEASGEGALALGRLARSRVPGTLRATAPPIVSRGGADEVGEGGTQGVLGSLRAFASSQVVLASEPISAIPTGGAGAVIVVPAGARFIPMVVLGWISELDGPGRLRGKIDTPYIGTYAYIIRLGTTPPVWTVSSTVSGEYEYWLGSDDIFSLTLVKAGEYGGLGDVTTAQFAAFGDRFQGLTGSIYVQTPPRSFRDGLTEVTPAFASVRVALVGILVEREESDA